MKRILLILAPTLFILLFCNLKTSAIGPVKIEGTVIDAANNEWIAYASVELLRQGDSTLVNVTTTNAEGKYVIENSPLGKYLLRISCLGYRKTILPEFELTASKPSVIFGSTALVSESQTLSEVTVQAQKLTGQIMEDKLVYAISSKSTEYVQSGLDLLRQLPDITVNFMSDEVKLAGSNNLLFQVNGRKVDQNYLLQLNPKMVDKIEVSTNPGVKYDSNVDAVINYVLKKTITYGLNTRLRVQTPVSEALLSKNNVNLDFYYQKFRIYVGSNYKYSRYKLENTNERTSLTGGESRSLTQQAESNILSNNGGVNYGIDWFPDKSNSFSFASAIQLNLPNHTDQTSANTHYLNSEVSQTTGNHYVRDKNPYYDYSLYYKHQFAKKFHELSIENFLSNRNTHHSDHYTEYQTSNEELLIEQNQQTGNLNRQLMVRVDYTYPFSEKLKLSAGYNGNFIRSKYTYAESVLNFSDALQYRENRQVLYSGLSLAEGKLNVQMGSRYEFSDITISHRKDTANQYALWFPSASVQYSWGEKHTIRLNYRKSVIRPDVNQLSSIYYSEDLYSEYIGNPTLKPAFIHRFEFTHRIQANKKTTINYIPYVTFIRNDIRQVVLAASNSPVLKRKYINVGNDMELGLTVSASVTPFEWWTISPSFTYFRRELQALPDYGINQSFKRTSFRTNVSSQWTVAKSWMAFIECNYNAPSINIQTTSHSTYECVIGMYKAISKKLNVSVFTLNPWNNRYVMDKRTLSTIDRIQVSEEALKYNYLFLFRLGYNFSLGKEGKRIERQREPEEVREVKKGVL